MKVLQFLSVSLLHWIPSYNVLTNKLHIYYTTMHCTLIGAIHRYYESRRRIFNDSQPERQSAADAAKKRAKRKQLRQNVSLQLTFTSCIICNINSNRIMLDMSILAIALSKTTEVHSV